MQADATAGPEEGSSGASVLSYPEDHVANRTRFFIIEHEGREQPFTVWRGPEAWQFTVTRDEAERYINIHLAIERGEGSVAA